MAEYSARGYYTTESTVPETVRPQVWKDWKKFHNRLYRRFSREDRQLEFKVGTKLVIEDVEFTIQYDDRCRMFNIIFHNYHKEIKGCCSLSTSRPYVYIEELQNAIDELSTLIVLES